MLTGAAAIGADARFTFLAVVGLVIVGDVTSARMTIHAIPGAERDVRTLAVVARQRLLNDLEKVAEAPRTECMRQRCAGISFTESFAQHMRMRDIRPAAGVMG